MGALDGTSVRSSRSVTDLGAPVGTLGRQAQQADRSINQLTGRIRLMADVAAMLGPALVPIGAVGIPAVTGLAAQLGFAAAAGGTALLAFQGVGDALKAANEYAIEPSAANLEKLHQAMQNISPEARALVTQLREMAPAFRELRDSAAAGLFPGVIEGLDALEDVLPRVEQLLVSVGDALGDIAADAGESLASDRWADFLTFIGTDAPPALADMASIVGDLAHGMAELWMAFDPLNDSFSGWLVDVAQSFDDFASGVSATQGFRELVDYIESTGPQVGETLGAVANALVQIVQAAAPIGGPVLQVVESLADALAHLADSDAGTALIAAAAGMAAFQRVAGIGMIDRNLVAPFKRMRDESQSLGSTLRQLAPAGAVIAGLGIAATGVADDLGVANAVTLGLAGSMAGPLGAAIGGSVGLLLDFRAANNDVTDSLRDMTSAMQANDAEALRSALADISNEIGDSSAWDHWSGRVDKLQEAFWAGTDALNALDDAAGRTDGLDYLLGSPIDLAHEFDVATSSVEEFASAFARLNTLLDTSGSLIAYEAALDDLTASLRENGQAWDAGTDAGRSNLEARNTLVSKAIERSEALKKAGDDLGAQRILDRAIGDLQAFAAESPKARQSIQPFIKELRSLNGQKAEPKVDPETEGARRKLNQIGHALGDVARQNPRPKVDVQDHDALGSFRGLLKAGGDVGRMRPKPRVDAETDQARGALQTVIGLLNAADRDVESTIRINTIRTESYRSKLDAMANSADGSTVPKDGGPYADRYPYLLAPGEEVISNRNGQADRWRPLLKAINAGRLADGGTATRGTGSAATASAANRTLDDLLAIAQTMQEIRQLKRDLARDGKNRLDGLNRRIAQLQLKAAEKELRMQRNREEREARQEARERAKEQRETLIERRGSLADLAGGLSFDNIAPGPELTLAQQARADINAFKAQVLEAGGVWDKSMRQWAQGVMATVHEYQALQGAIERETAKRDQLAEALADQQSQMAELVRTMESYSAQVAGNFISNPFNQSRTEMIPGAPGPASVALSSAQAQLAAIRSSATGDSVGAAAEASRLIAQIAGLEERAAAEVAPQERVVSGVELLRETLDRDIEQARRMTEALNTLSAKGLDTSGELGLLYEQLAASGDVVTAEELARLSSAQIDEYERLFAAREDAAAAVGALVTQEVYGQQQAQLQALITAQTEAIARSDATLVTLNAEIAVVGEQVRMGAENGVESMGPQLAAMAQEIRQLKHAVSSIPRQQAEQKRMAKP